MRKAPNTTLIGLAVIVAISIGLATPGFAALSGLIIIPTVDKVPDGQFLIEPEVDTLAPIRQADIYLLSTEFGIGNRLESGVDFHLSEDTNTTSLYTIKYVVPGVKRRPPIAFGVHTIGNNATPSEFLVATQEFVPFAVTWGLLTSAATSAGLSARTGT